MKVLKIILYQLGIYEERQNWINKDFMGQYNKKEKDRIKQVETEISKC